MLKQERIGSGFHDFRQLLGTKRMSNSTSRPMDALERVIQIRKKVIVPAWGREDFLRAASRGKHRWQETEALFGITYSMFRDAVSEIAPSFELAAEEKAIAEAADVPGMRNVNSRIAVFFLKWERCSETSSLSNPYEPWMEIWEHGGAFSVEHGQFVDVFDQDHMPLGAVVVRRA
jgi:hypothetical protein